MQFFRLLKYAGKYKKYLILCPLVMIGDVVMEMMLPTLTATLIDKIIPELGVANKQTISNICDYIKTYMEEFLEEYSAMTPEAIVDDRYARFRKF